jgi:hypothetical protein
MRSNPTFVIPGWSEGPDPESRDSGFDASHRPEMTKAPGEVSAYPATSAPLTKRQQNQALMVNALLSVVVYFV